MNDKRRTGETNAVEAAEATDTLDGDPYYKLKIKCQANNKDPECENNNEDIIRTWQMIYNTRAADATKDGWKIPMVLDRGFTSEWEIINFRKKVWEGKFNLKEQQKL